MHFCGKVEESQKRFYKCNHCNYECTFEGSLRTHQECQKGYMWKDAFIFLYKLMNHKRDSHAVYAVMHAFILVLWGNTTSHWIKAINVTSVTTILFTRELLRFIMLLLHVHLQMFFRKTNSEVDGLGPLWWCQQMASLGFAKWHPVCNWTYGSTGSLLSF